MKPSDWTDYLRARHVTSASDFDEAWQKLADRGACDELGGSEYRRVVAEWIAAQRPAAIEQFIRVRANIGPDGLPSN